MEGIGRFFLIKIEYRVLLPYRDRDGKLTFCRNRYKELTSIGRVP